MKKLIEHFKNIFKKPKEPTLAEQSYFLTKTRIEEKSKEFKDKVLNHIKMSIDQGDFSCIFRITEYMVPKTLEDKILGEVQVFLKNNGFKSTLISTEYPSTILNISWDFSIELEDKNSEINADTFAKILEENQNVER